jgi:hypothetical protein
MKIHSSITVARICDAVEHERNALDNPGFCIRCGAETDGVEPDARDYPCESCGENGVYGAEELLMEVSPI